MTAMRPLAKLLLTTVIITRLLCVEPVGMILTDSELSEDATTADYVWRMSVRQWVRQAQLLSGALQKMVTFADDNHLLSPDVTNRYLMSRAYSCTVA